MSSTWQLHLASILILVGSIKERKLIVPGTSTRNQPEVSHRDKIGTTGGREKTSVPQVSTEKQVAERRSFARANLRFVRLANRILPGS